MVAKKYLSCLTETSPVRVKDPRVAAGKSDAPLLSTQAQPYERASQVHVYAAILPIYAAIAQGCASHTQRPPLDLDLCLRECSLAMYDLVRGIARLSERRTLQTYALNRMESGLQ